MSKLYVLDTNVLIHDPAAMFNFGDNDVFIPMVVLEELDRNKKGLTDEARNARQASRFLEELIHDPVLPGGGLLYFQTFASPEIESSNDNEIIAVTKTLDMAQGVAGIADQEVILVTKDINMRIKAAMRGVTAEDYRNDKAIDDIALLPSGWLELPADFWDNGGNVQSWKDKGQTFYTLEGPLVASLHSNQFVFSGEFEAVVLGTEDGKAILKLLTDYRKVDTWGVKAKNREQNFALNALLDPEIDFVTILGKAGSGKTLLALAAGIAQVMDKKLYQEVIITRETFPVGRDIGFLPGTEDEKMGAWNGSILDNLEVLNVKDHSVSERAMTNDLLKNRIKVRSLNFMRGRSFMNRYILIEEAQNLTAGQMKTMITRAGLGTKIVCIGNLAQIDAPYITPTTSGLTYAIKKFQGWDHAGNVILSQCERSRLAEFAEDNL
jgi:PhoH-like ATPase